jgi:excisionase family DNA binding protein
MGLKSIREISLISGQSEATIRKWIRGGKFPSYRPGGKTLIDPAEFESFVRRSKVVVGQDAEAMEFLKEFCA